MVLSQEKYLLRKKKMMQEITRDLNINYIKTNKYKTIKMVFYFSNKYTFKERLSLSLLRGFIGRYSQKYPTKNDMRAIKDNLYCASIGSAFSIYNELLTYRIRFSFINPKFLKDVTFKDYLNFFDECLNNPFFSEELLEEYKREIKLRVSHNLDKPDKYGRNRVNKLLMEKDEEFKIFDADIMDYFDEITLQDVKDIYHKVISDYNLDIYLYGDFNDEVLSYLNKYKKHNEVKLVKNRLVDIEEFGEIIEDKNVSQSYLYSVYATKCNSLSNKVATNLMTACVLGNAPTSLLFAQVREKMSLCYGIGIENMANEGLVIIRTAIDKKNKDEVLKQIDIQIKRVIDKDYDLNNIDVIRNGLLASFEGVEDDLIEYFSFDYTLHINGIKQTLEEYIESIKKVTADDISACLKDYQHIFTYMLRGVKDA